MSCSVVVACMWQSACFGVCTLEMQACKAGFSNHSRESTVRLKWVQEDASVDGALKAVSRMKDKGSPIDILGGTWAFRV